MRTCVAHQFYSKPASTDALAGPVKTRQVLYIQGFFPKGSTYYHRLLGAEIEAFCELNGFEATLSPLGGSGHHLSHCTVKMRRGAEEVTTSYHFLEWHDLIEAEIRKDLPATFATSARTFFAHLKDGAAFFMMRSFWKYFAAWFLPYLLFAAIGIFSVMLGFYAFALFSVANGFIALLKLLISAAVLAGLWKLNRLYWSSLMLCNFNMAADFAKGRLPALEKRIADFADVIADTARTSQADEILIVGHSFGTQLAVLATAKALQAKGFENKDHRIKLLTLGDATCHIGALQGPGASAMRRSVIALASQNDLPWLLLYSGKDVLCFNTADPPSALSRLEGVEKSVEDFRWPVMLDARFREMIAWDDYRKLRWRFFHMHSQFIFAARILGSRYDYIRTICGGQPLPLAGKRVSQHCP